MYAIVAGMLWLIALVFCYHTGPFDPNQPQAKTCCIPEIVDDTGVYPAAYKALSTAAEEPDHTDISILEMVQSDGSIVTEKVTTYLNGRKSVEVTTTRK